MKNFIITIIVIAVVVIIGMYAWKNIGVNKTTLPTTTTETTPEATPQTTETEQSAVAEKTPIEVAFDKAKDVEIKSEKAKAVDVVLRPVLKEVFDVVVEEEVVVGVKMREEFGPMLTYAFNHKVTEIERNAIISGLEAVGYVEAGDNTEKIVQVKKGSSVWTITFYLNNEAKSGLEVTF